MEFIWNLFGKRKQIIINGKKSTILSYGTSEDQNRRIKLLEHLYIIGNKLTSIEFYLHEDNEIYTFRKKDIYICLQDINTIEDLNVLVYVFIHELTHVICKNSINHDYIFLQTFKKLLESCKNMNYLNLTKKEYKYCKNKVIII